MSVQAVPLRRSSRLSGGPVGRRPARPKQVLKVEEYTEYQYEKREAGEGKEKELPDTTSGDLTIDDRRTYPR